MVSEAKIPLFSEQLSKMGQTMAVLAEQKMIQAAAIRVINIAGGVHLSFCFLAETGKALGCLEIQAAMCRDETFLFFIRAFLLAMVLGNSLITAAKAPNDDHSRTKT